MTTPTADLIRAALACIPATLPRDEWAKVGMAIKSAFPDEAGFDLFDTWSQRDPDGYDAKAVRDTWKSVKPSGGVTIATLLHLAQQHGFELPKSDAAAPAAPDAAEVERQRQQRAEREQDERQARQQTHAEAAQRARALWDAATEAPADHGYLRRKGVQPHGLRVGADGWLLVPMRDAEGTLWNVQRIAPEQPAKGSDKLFQKGGRKTGLWHMLGDPAGAATLLLAEGYATAASVHEAGQNAGGWPVAVAFDAGNLVHVARELRRLYPAALLVLCGDDDRATAERTGTNTGRVKAEAAARAVGGVAVFPAGLQGDASDFNDLHQARGLDAVRAAVQAAMDAAATQPPANAQKQRQRPGNGPAGAGGGNGGGADEAADHDPFVVNDDGVHYLGRGRDGERPQLLWLCSRLDVAALVHDQEGNGWGYLLEFDDRQSHAKQWIMPAGMLSGDGNEYRATLRNMGLRINTAASAKAPLTKYIDSRGTNTFASYTNRTGWHKKEGGAAFVLPRLTIGDDAERILFQSDTTTENSYSVRNDASAWRARIGALCTGNARLVFAVASAFAGPLVLPAGAEGGGFHLRGLSSTGKTTALRVASSVYGGADFMKQWRATENGLEPLAVQHCDTLLILDEIKQIDAKAAGIAAYMLANGKGKVRATRAAGLRQSMSWRLLFLSSGELSLADHMASVMQRTHTGQEVRMADIPADAGLGMGMFENIHGYDSVADFAGHLNDEVRKVYGAPGRAFIEWACTHWAELPKRLHDGLQTFTTQWVPEGASSQVWRVAARFALVAVAGELATEADLTGWPTGESERASRACFNVWLAARGGAGDGEVTAMLRQARRFLEVNGEGRFTWWHRANDDRSPKTLNRAGLRRLINEHGEPITRDSQHLAEFGNTMPADRGEGVGVEYFILPETFRSEVAQGFDAQTVARVLRDHGCLQSDSDRLTARNRLPGFGHISCYHITPKLFELDL